jgi:hypothetical protein
MDINQLIAFLHRIYVWIPKNNAMRTELENVINQLKSQRPQ